MSKLKLVSFDLKEASDGRRITLSHSLGAMRFRRILETVWISDTHLTVSEIRSRMKLQGKDKGFVVEIDDDAALSQYGLLKVDLYAFEARKPKPVAADLLESE